MGTLRTLKKALSPTSPSNNNPYSHPSHPNHCPKPAAMTAILKPGQHAASADNMLAEARLAVGRDPTTGRRRQAQRGRARHEEAPNTEEISAYNARNATQVHKQGTRYDLLVQDLKQRSRSHPPPSTAPNASLPAASLLISPASSADPARPTSQPETSAYITRVSATRKSMGARYDLFVKSMLEKREAERAERERREREGEREPVGGYFAPPPKMPVEYYAPRPGVRPSTINKPSETATWSTSLGDLGAKKGSFFWKKK